MRLMLLSGAPWASAGYSTQARLLVKMWKTLGYQTAVLAYHGLKGGIIQHHGTTVYPGRRDQFGNDAVWPWAQHWRADMVFSLLDLWVLDPGKMGPCFCPLFPIDHEPLPEAIRVRAKAAFQPIVYSQFGLRVAQEAGLDARYVPHAIDCTAFQPGPKQLAREQLGFPQDAFIIGMVAANAGQLSRKALPQHLEAFARFHAKHKDTLLYLHTDAWGEQDGLYLPALVEHLGLSQSVRCPDPNEYALGFPTEHLTALYRAFDVLASVSMGEGFGLPILEAQACGCPVIVGDWTSMPELCFGGWKVDKADAEPFWTPMSAYQYLPRIDAIVEAFDAAYLATDRELLGKQARKGAQAYDVKRVAELWRPVLDELQQRLQQRSARALLDQVAGVGG